MQYRPLFLASTCVLIITSACILIYSTGLHGKMPFMKHQAITLLASHMTRSFVSTLYGPSQFQIGLVKAYKQRSQRYSNCLF